jgi:uncharacterized protein YecE (DUF72 family)
VQFKFFLGTSGFNYKDWKEIFYPKGLAQNKWLAFYAKHYDTVEINAAFYRYFPSSVFARWRDETPEIFRFALKGPRTITHVKRLNEINDDLDQFFNSSRVLGSKLAVVLWQFPFSFKYESEEALAKITSFLQQLPSMTKHVVEFRHNSWFKDDVYALLDTHGTGFVINDSSRFPAVEIVTGNVVYIRFHGPTKLYASSYSTQNLQTWAKKIKAWLQRYDVYSYFNNDYGGRAIANSVELRGLIEIV